MTLPIVILPGMDGTGELLRDFSDSLSAHRSVQVIAYPIQRPLGYDELTMLVLSQVPEQPFVILGESFSGPIAIEVAARQKRTAGLILASTFVRHPIPTFVAPLTRFFDHTCIPQGLVAASLLGSAGTDDLKARLHEVLVKLPPDIIRTRAYEACRVDKRDALRKAKCPLLYLHGRDDRFIGQRCIREITAIRPDCQFRKLAAPHMLLETHASEAADIIERFCSQLG